MSTFCAAAQKVDKVITKNKVSGQFSMTTLFYPLFWTAVQKRGWLNLSADFKIHRLNVTLKFLLARLWWENIRIPLCLCILIWAIAPNSILQSLTPGSDPRVDPTLRYNCQISNRAKCPKTKGQISTGTILRTATQQSSANPTCTNPGTSRTLRHWSYRPSGRHEGTRERWQPPN